jgi:hypothetical protein
LIGVTTPTVKWISLGSAFCRPGTQNCKIAASRHARSAAESRGFTTADFQSFLGDQPKVTNPFSSVVDLTASRAEREKQVGVMATVLDKPLKREVEIDGQSYMLTITPDGVKITLKGKRIGREMSWRDLLSGDAELASQLVRSVSDTSSKRKAPP